MKVIQVLKRVTYCVLLIALLLSSQIIKSEESSDSVFWKPMSVNIVSIGTAIKVNHLYPNSYFGQHTAPKINFKFGFAYIQNQLGVYVDHIRQNYNLNILSYQEAYPSITNLSVGQFRLSATTFGAVWQYIMHEEPAIAFRLNFGLALMNVITPNVSYDEKTGQGNNTNKVILDQGSYPFMGKHFCAEILLKVSSEFYFNFGFETLWGEAEMLDKNKQVVWNNFEKISSSNLRFGLGFNF